MFESVEEATPQILKEIQDARLRQIELGKTPARDDLLTNGLLASMAAALCYLSTLDAERAKEARLALNGHYLDNPPRPTPLNTLWGTGSEPPDMPRRDFLVQSAALIVAEIERLDRAATEPNTG